MCPLSVLSRKVCSCGCGQLNLAMIRKSRAAPGTQISFCHVCLHPALSMTAIAAECAGINFPFGVSGAASLSLSLSTPLLLYPLFFSSLFVLYSALYIFYLSSSSFICISLHYPPIIFILSSSFFSPSLSFPLSLIF